MIITDELRKWMDTIVMPFAVEVEIKAIADRIDARHESELMSEYSDGAQEVMSEDGYVKLPVDADGVPWHIGDESDHGTVDCMTLCDDGCWMIEGDDALYNPETMHHVQPDTWERIIEDAICGDGRSYGCLDERIEAIAPDLVARCKALAGEDA